MRPPAGYFHLRSWDLFATKLNTIQHRAECKDYIKEHLPSQAAAVEKIPNIIPLDTNLDCK